MEILCILSIILITQMHQVKILLEDSPSSQKLCDYYYFVVVLKSLSFFNAVIVLTCSCAIPEGERHDN